MQNYIDHFNLPCKSYEELHRYSLTPPFWDSLFSFFPLLYEGSLAPQRSGAAWYPHIKLCYAENLLRHTHKEALTYLHESGTSRSLSFAQLRSLVGGLQQRALLSPGDTAACYSANTPEALAAMLAANASGAPFASLASDFGVSSAIDRLEQIQPKVLFAQKSYTYKHKTLELTDRIDQMIEAIPSIKQVIWLDEPIAPASPTFTRLPFDATTFILFSSGTTGKPKAICHRNGGVLLQHLKELGLHYALTPQDSMLFFTTTGWMMWNWLASALFFGSRIGLFDGCPTALNFLELVHEHKFTHLGVSPKLLSSFTPRPMPHLKALLSTGAPLPAEQFDWAWEHLHPNMKICSMSGGTDILGCFALGHPTLPNPAGELQCIGLGMDVAAFDPDGKPLIGTPGELVCRNETPSMPKGFLNDPDGARFQASYFERFPGVWHHGDFIRISKSGSCRIDGRSDATLNPQGVRIGTAEIYRKLESLPAIDDALAVQKGEEIWLFVKLAADASLDEAAIKAHIRKECSPRHVPAQIRPVEGIPYTQNGKKLEILVSRLVNGKSVENLAACANPDVLVSYRLA